MGRVTGRGLASNIKTIFPPIVLVSLVTLLLLANILNIAADLAAMGEVAALVTGLNWHLMTALFVFITLILQILLPYHRYVYFLKWLTLSLLAYAAVLITVHVPWDEVAWRTFFPSFELSASAAAVVVAIFGTTISPYLFFWQASQEVEEMKLHHQAHLLLESDESAKSELTRIKWDTWGGMFYSSHRSDLAHCWHPRYHHGSTSRLCAQTACWRVSLLAICSRHTGRWPNRCPGAGRVGGLRCR